MENIGWGLEMTVIGMGIVFLMLIILMISLMIMGMFDKPEADEPAAIEAAPVAAPVAAAPVAVAAAPAGGMTDEKIATLAVAIHTALRGGGNKPALVANQSGSGLNESRWVAIGRSMQTQSWHRS